MTATLRIAHCTDSYLPRRDGVVTSVRVLAGEQEAAGHAVLRVFPRHRNQPAESRVLRLRSVPGGPAGLRLAGWPRSPQLDRIRAFAPHVVHVHTPGPAGLLGVWAARQLGVPLIYTYHTNLHAGAQLYRMPGWLLAAGIRAYARRLRVAPPATVPAGPGAAARRHALVDGVLSLVLGGADAVLVPSRAVLARDPLPVPAERLRVVPTAVLEPPALEPGAGPDFRRRYGIAAGAPLVLVVGRVGTEKNVELAIAAFGRVRAELPAARLLLVGEVLRPRRVAGWLAAAGAAAATVLTGVLPPERVAHAYAAADVLALPSRYETQALVVAEAAWQTVPAVLADPVLAAGDPLAADALLAPPDPAGYGAALLDLLTDAGRRRRYGSTAYDTVSRYRTAGYAASVLTEYQRVLPARTVPTR